MPERDSGYIKSRNTQFIPFSSRLEVEADVSRRLEGAIVVGGCAYELNMLDALSGGVVSAGGLLSPTPEWLTHRQKLRYNGDLDVYSSLPDSEVLQKFGPAYEQRSSKFTKDPVTGKDRPRQRKIQVGTVQLKEPIDGKPEWPVYLALDVIDRMFYTTGYQNGGMSFPNPDYALAGLEKNTKTANILGQPVRFQGANDFIAFKLLNIQRGDEAGKPKTWIKDASDIANLIVHRPDPIDWQYIAELMGSKQLARERLTLARTCLVDPDTSMEEDLIRKLMAEQQIEPFREVSRHTIVGGPDKREEYVRRMDETIAALSAG